MIPKSIYKHIEPEMFYRLYNLVKSYFTDSYDVYWSLYKSDTDINYRKDNLKIFYDNISLKISNAEEALLIILANIIENENGYINSFDTECKYFYELLRYSRNKFTIIDDFAELCSTTNIYDKIETGVLADETIRLKKNIVLLSYVNSVINIIDISSENLLKNEPLDLYNFEFKEQEDDSDSMFSKLSSFLVLSNDEIKFLKPKLNKILEDNKNIKLKDDIITIDDLHNVTYQPLT